MSKEWRETSKVWIILASVDDPVERSLLTNTILNDPGVYRLFSSAELACDALDEFCERKGLAMSLFNVQDVIA